MANYRTMLMILTIIASSIGSLARSAEPQLITPFLAEPIPTKWPRKIESRRPVLSDLLRSSREPTILLASDDGRASLLVDPNRSGFGTPLPLPVEAYDLHLAEGLDDSLWIGGYSRPRTSMFSVPLSSAYLAKVDRLGHFFWKREFGGETRRTIESMVSLPSGDIVVSGQDGFRTWLANISSDGKVIWERFVGLGKGSAVTTIDGAIALAAVEPDPRGPSYREDVAIWTFDAAGESLNHQTIREGINRKDSDSSGRIQIERGNGAFYVFSAWGGYGLAKPLEVVRFDLQKGVVWRKELAETIIQELKGPPTACSTVTTVLSNGDPLVACRPEAREIELSRFDAKSGAIVQSVVHFSAPPPDCSEFWEFWAQQRFLKQISETAVWILGSPYESGGSSCGWIAEAPIPKAK
jgi:hypothetical protein